MKKKEKSATFWRKKCVTWAKLEARKRDRDRCQYCGVTKEQGYAIHGSHILPEGTYISMSADVDNIIALCAQHHLAGANPRMGNKVSSWHSDPLLFAEWFDKKYPGKKQELRKRAQTIQVINWQKRWEEIKEYDKVLDLLTVS